MSYVIGAVLGVRVTFIGFVIVMAPRHWEWYQENIDLRSQLKVAVERAAHYQQLATPNQWGPVEQHEARIVTKPTPPYQGVTLEPGESIDFVFDDIRETP